MAPMSVFEEIISGMKIEAPAQHRPAPPEIVKHVPLSGVEQPQTADELSAILLHYGFPALESDGSLSARIEMLVALEQAGISTTVDCEALRASLERIEKYKQVESVCDMYEIDLANIEASGHLKYKGMATEELQALAAQRREEFEMVSSLRPIDAGVLHKMLDARDLAGLAESLEFLRDETAGAAIYMQAVGLLQARQDDWCRALLLIISGVTSVDELGGALKIDRVGVLRIIYQLCSKGILDYDRLADTVCLFTDE